MFALVRGLVEWIPTSADWAGYVAGPLVVVGYLAGSIPVGELLATRRFRQQLEAGNGDSVRAGRAELDRAAVSTGAITAAIALVAATIAWDVGHQAAPPGSFSAIGTYANQAIGAWASMALWTGAAVMLGSMAPVWTGFRRGGTGLGPAAALFLVYAPLLGLVGLAAGSVAYGLGQRWRTALAIGCGAIVAAEYLAWITDTQSGWGITNGPELALWCAVVSTALAARNVRQI